MDRRHFLAAAAGAGVVGTAAFASGSSPTRIADPTITSDDGETVLRFSDAGDVVGTISIDVGDRQWPSDADGQVPVTISISHPGATAIEGLRLELRPQTSPVAPAEVALSTPFGTPHPAMEFYTDPDDGGHVLAIDDIGEQGDGTLTFEFLIRSLDGTATELTVDASVSLTGYTLEGLTLVPLPTSDA